MPARFAFVEYESRRDADDAYIEMHGRRIGRDDLLKIEVGYSPTYSSQIFFLILLKQWARTPPSASWRFDGGRDAPRSGGRRGGSPRRRSVSRGRDSSPRRDRRGGDRDRSRSPMVRKDDEPRRNEDERDRSPAPANGEERDHRKGMSPIVDDMETEPTSHVADKTDSPLHNTLHDDLDTADADIAD